MNSLDIIERAVRGNYTVDEAHCQSLVGQNASARPGAAISTTSQPITGTPMHQRAEKAHRQTTVESALNEKAFEGKLSPSTAMDNTHTARQIGKTQNEINAACGISGLFANRLNPYTRRLATSSTTTAAISMS